MMEILATKHIPEREEFHMVREIPHHSGQGTMLNLLIMPEDAMEWRAAEYRLDPLNVDLLLDVVLYETHLDEGEGFTRQSLLVTAATIEDARALHLHRVGVTKQRLRPQGPRKWKSNAQRLDVLGNANPDLANEWEPHIVTDALECARDNHVMEPELIAAKMEMVERARRNYYQRMMEKTARRGRRSTQDRLQRLTSLQDINGSGLNSEGVFGE